MPIGTQSKIQNPKSKIAIAIVVVGIIAILYWTFRDHLTLAALAARETELRAYQHEHWLALYVAAFAIYFLVAAFSIPAATALTLTIGWLFGFRWGLLLVSFASTSGATTAFLISRYLLRDYVAARFRELVPSVTSALEKDGALYLFAMRLTPAVPFVVVNLVMGLTGLRTRTFWWVSQLGMLPATAIFVYAGSTVPNLQQFADRGPQSLVTWPLVTAFILLGLFPFAARRVMEWLRRKERTVP